MILPEVIEAAQAAQRKWRVWASVALAQYGVESAWGRFEPPGSNNGFGIQRLAGLPYVSSASHEFRNGKMVPVVEEFAVFASVADAFDHHAELLATSSAYRKAMSATTADAFALALTGVYASAPNYGSALIALMKEDNLYQYDVADLPPLGVPANKISTVEELQVALRDVGYAIDDDGIFGVETRNAVKAFQAKAGIDVDGDVGPETISALQKAVD